MATEDENDKKKTRWLSNPAVREYDGQEGYDEHGEPLTAANTFTVAGAAFKTLILLAILSVTFAYSWNIATQGYSEAYSALQSAREAGASNVPNQVPISPAAIPLIVGGCLGGFVVAMVVIFWQRSAPFLSPIYAGLEGLALGGISAAFEAKYPGIALEAVGATLGTAFGMLFLYSTGIIRPTKKFMIGLLAAMLGILCLYLVDMVMMAFGSYVPVVHSNGTWGIILSGAIVCVAALNLIVDFGQITDAAEGKAPKSYEWYCGFSILVTLVWLYLELLRLLAKLRGGD